MSRWDYMSKKCIEEKCGYRINGMEEEKMERALDRSAGLTAVRERAREEDSTGNFQSVVQS